MKEAFIRVGLPDDFGDVSCESMVVHPDKTVTAGGYDIDLKWMIDYARKKEAKTATEEDRRIAYAKFEEFIDSMMDQGTRNNSVIQ